RGLATSDVLSCEFQCQANSDCLAYTFNKWKHACFLKSTIGSLNINATAITGVRNDLPTPANATGPIRIQSYPGQTFGEGGYSNRPSSARNCEATCVASSQCVAYSFKKDTDRCSVFSEVNEPPVSDDNVDSGIKLQRSR